jgi:ribosomal protein S3AE
MAKPIKKKFFEVEIPILNEKYEIYANNIQELENRTMRMDLTRQLRGKSVDMVFYIKVENNKAIAFPKKLTILPFFIKHMLHTGIDYVEDSFKADILDGKADIKPFFITRKKVSRAIRRTLRNSAKNWLTDYVKTKNSDELFQEVLNNQLQKQLSLKLKKIYPLAICEIRILDVKLSPVKKTEEKNKEDITKD